MTFQALKSKVESLLRQAEFGAALSLIESFTNQPGFQGSSLRENALLLSARYASLKDLQIKGTLKHEEYSKELARLADSIVSMLRETAPPQPAFSFKTPIIIVVLTAILGIGLWWMFKPDQIEPKALERCKEACASFMELAGPLLDNWDADQAGHDFWLSRNGHGVGFFDRSEIADKETRDALQNICRRFGERYCYSIDENTFGIE